MVEITDEQWEIIKSRVKQMPPHLSLSIGGKGPFNKEELINHVEQKSEIGHMVAEIELAYLKALKKL